MLEDLVANETIHQVIRISIDAPVNEFLDELQFDPRDEEDLRELLAEIIGSESLDNLLDSPFRSKPKSRQQSRFSDGTFPVFYSSMDEATAESEVRYWFPRYTGISARKFTKYYRIFSRKFNGLGKDLRPKSPSWPDLLHGDDYTFCNMLGEEAVNSGLDGLITFSVRKSGGVNLPVFSRAALSEPVSLSYLQMTYDPHTGEVSTQRFDDLD